MKTLDFIGVGGLSYDLVLRVERLPSTDDKIPGKLVGRLPGGFIANATCAAARLGLKAGYIGWAGEDAEGEMLAADFARYEIHLAGLAHVPGEATPFTVVLVNDDGERAIVIPSFTLYQQSLTEAQIAFAQRAHIVFTYPRDGNWCQALADAAHTDGGIFALDVESTSPMMGIALQAAIEDTDVLFVTDSSLPLTGVSSIVEIAGPQWIVMTAGKSGAYGYEAGFEQVVHQPAFFVEVADTTGAGDCFHAAVLAARYGGASLPEALAFASAAAAIKIQREGARGGLPTWNEVETFLGSALRGA
jgi:sugar/nucleoside kinase (ribokinase family)